MAEVNLEKMIKKASRQHIAFYQKDSPGKVLPLANVRNLLALRVWVIWIGRLGICERQDTPLRLERIVRELMRAGVDKEHIRYRNGAFHIQLKQRDYLLYKTYDQTVYVEIPSLFAWNPVRVEEKLFASFLLAFDAAYSEISSHAEAVAEAIRRNAVEYKKEKMIERIRRITSIR